MSDTPVATVTEIISVGNYNVAAVLQRGLAAEMNMITQVLEFAGRWAIVSLDSKLTTEAANQATGFCIGVLWAKGRTKE